METENQEEQVNSMLANFFPQPPTENAEVENGQEGEETQIVEGAPAEEETSPVEETKGEERVETEETKPEVEPEPIVEVEEPESEISVIKKQNEILMKRIEELSERIVSSQPVEKTPEEQLKEDVLDIIGDADIDDVLASKELFNAAIAKAMKMSEERAIQKVLVSIPNIVMRQTQQQMAIKQATDEFYLENPDLEPMKKTVAAVANEIYSTNPQLTVAEIFQKSAEKTREILGLRKTANRLINEPGRTPDLVKRTQGGNKQKAPSVDKLQQELNDLLNF